MTPVSTGMCIYLFSQLLQKPQGCLNSQLVCFNRWTNNSMPGPSLSLRLYRCRVVECTSTISVLTHRLPPPHSDLLIFPSVMSSIIFQTSGGVGRVRTVRAGRAARGAISALPCCSQSKLGGLPLILCRYGFCFRFRLYHLHALSGSMILAPHPTSHF